MAWCITNWNKEKRKSTVENPVWPLSKAIDVGNGNLTLSGGTKHAGVMAFAIICAYDVDTVIEIGLWQGYTSLILGRALAANAMDKGLLVSCDINERAINRSKKMTADLPIEHVHICSDSKDVDYKKHLKGRSVGLAFVDGLHTYDATMADMLNCSAVLKGNGLMIVHDYSKNHAKHKEVYRCVNDFVEEYKWPMFYLPENRKSTDYHTVILQKA